MLNIEIDADGIALLTIDMPGRTLNVIDWALAEAIDNAAQQLAVNQSVRGVILTSARTSFVVGADLGIISAFAAAGMSLTRAADEVNRLGAPLRRLEQIGKPVVAAAPGTALGGGLELMLACHYRIAVATESARFGMPEVGLGLLPGAGGTQRLSRLIGATNALPLLIGGASLSAEEALSAGILDELVPVGDLLPAARRALSQGRVPAAQPWDVKGFTAPGPAMNSPSAMGLFQMSIAAAQNSGAAYPASTAILSCVFEGLRLPIDKGLKVEREYFARLATEPQAHALIAARFFLRQRMTKRGILRGDSSDPQALACVDAVRAETVRMVREGIPSNRIVNAAIAAGLPASSLSPIVASSERVPQQCAALSVLARRLLLAGALAVADCDDPDATDLAAVDGAGYPEWTGGPIWLIDSCGPAAFVAEAQAFGLPIPDGLAVRAARDSRYRTP